MTYEDWKQGAKPANLTQRPSCQIELKGVSRDEAVERLAVVCLTARSLKVNGVSLPTMPIRA